MPARTITVLFDDASGPHYFVYQILTGIRSSSLHLVVCYLKEQKRAGNIWNVKMTRMSGRQWRA